MPAEARVTPIWKKQKLFLALFFYGVSVLFFHDGIRGYPASNERWKVYEKFKKEDQLENWTVYASEHGWSDTPPHKFYESSDIAGQYFFGGLGLLVGSVGLVFWLMQKGRLIRTDEQAVYTPDGVRVPFEEITGMDRRKWEAKGLATVHYRAGKKTGSFILDDYKFERDPVHQIFSEIEVKARSQSEGKDSISTNP